MRLLLLLFCLCNATPVFAFDDLTLRFGSITGEGWQMHNVVVHLQGLSSKKPALSINIATFNWVLLKKTLRKLEFQCSDSQYTVAKIICPYATLHLKSQLLDEPEVKLSFSYDIAQQRIHFNVQRLAFANGYITIQSKVVGTGWWIKCHIQQVDLKKMLTTLNTLITIPQTFTFGGETTLTLEITGATTIQQAKINGQFSALSFSNAAGSQAFENLTGKIIVNAQQTAASWRGQITLTIEQGELYSEPVYIGVEAKQPLNATIDLTWQTSQLTIHHFAYTHTGILAVEGFSDLLFNQALNQVSVKQLTVQLAQSSLANIYTHYVQTWISNEQLKQLSVNGLVTARLEWDDENRYFIMKLLEVSLEDKNKVFGLARLSGTLQWHNRLENLPTHLSWDKAYLTALNLAGSQLSLNLTGKQIELLRPFRQKILDGMLLINRFKLAHLGQENMQFEFSGELQPLSVARLTAAFKLPVLKGKMFGKIPLLRYEQTRLEMTDTLQFRLFDGNVTITKLQIEDLFGQVPKLLADVEVDKISLQALTKVTDFGEIQGDLSGYIHDLQLVNWTPVSFDAQFSTPPETTKPRRISQKAIDNLSSLNGGGAVNAVSRNFLRLFENFAYQSLGWGCRLHNGICEMRGVAPAAKGYYIIKGGGLPRINVIGYNQRVDWNVLVNRLKNITQTEEAIIK